MIREATLDDVPRLMEMGLHFGSEPAYCDWLKVAPEVLEMTIGQFIESTERVILVSGSDATVTGMIAVALYDHPFSGEKTAAEFVWWVEPEARGDGVRLLRAAEGWARALGARRMLMIAPSDRVGDFYRRVGYSQAEVSFQRSL